MDNRVYALGLSVLDTEATTLHICSSEPASFAAVAGVTLGNVALDAGDIGAPAAGSPDGRPVTVAAKTGGAVTADGTASHYAIVDATNSRLLAADAFSASQGVTSGNPFNTGSFTIRIPAPV